MKAVPCVQSGGPCYYIKMTRNSGKKTSMIAEDQMLNSKPDAEDRLVSHSAHHKNHGCTMEQDSAEAQLPISHHALRRCLAARSANRSLVESSEQSNIRLYPCSSGYIQRSGICLFCLRCTATAALYHQEGLVETADF